MFSLKSRLAIALPILTFVVFLGLYIPMAVDVDGDSHYTWFLVRTFLYILISVISLTVYAVRVAKDADRPILGSIICLVISLFFLDLFYLASTRFLPSDYYGHEASYDAYINARIIFRHLIIVCHVGLGIFVSVDKSTYVPVKTHVSSMIKGGGTFYGTVGGWFVNALVSSLIVTFSFGIATPYAYCRMIRWTTENTNYNGQRLVFKGEGGDLMGKWLLWMLLSIVTFGIYAIWIPTQLDQYRVRNTVLYCKKQNTTAESGTTDTKPKPKVSVFYGTTGGWFINALVASLIITFSFGIAAPYAYCRMVRWTQENTTYSGQRVIFRGEASSLMGKWLLWMLLTIVTCGIYSLWIPVKLDQWRVHNTTLYIKQQPASNIATETPTNATETKPVVKEK